MFADSHCYSNLFKFLQWILDALICNGLGIFLGLQTLKYFSMKTYHWRGLWHIKTYRSDLYVQLQITATQKTRWFLEQEEALGKTADISPIPSLLKQTHNNTHSKIAEGKITLSEFPNKYDDFYLGDFYFKENICIFI